MQMQKSNWFETKYKFCLYKNYWEKGYGLTSIFKPLLYGVIGLTAINNNIKLTLILGSVYTLLCFFIGYFWYNHGMVFAESEVGNQFNFFQKEVRDYIKKKSLNRKK